MDPQAGEPGPCIVRARGAREHGKDAPPSSLLTGGGAFSAVGTIVDELIARESNPKTSPLEREFNCFGGFRPTYLLWNSMQAVWWGLCLPF